MSHIALNEYVEALGHDYTWMSKPVFAAVALSLAMRLCADDTEAAKRMLRDEWRTLHENGIVVQKPAMDARDGAL